MMKRFFSVVFLMSLFPSLFSGGFIAGTLINISSDQNIYKKIEDLRVGDVVTSFSFKQNAISKNKIVSIQTEAVSRLIRIMVNGKYIDLAPEQRFFIPLTNIEITAQELLLSDEHIFTFMQYELFEDIEEVLLQQPVVIYKLTVESDHNFYISEKNILVHNEALTIAAIGITFGAGGVALDTAVTVGAIVSTIFYWFIGNVIRYFAHAHYESDLNNQPNGGSNFPGTPPHFPIDPKHAEWFAKWAITHHGYQRLVERGFETNEIATTMASSRFYQQANGAISYIKEVLPGKFNVIVKGTDGIVTALKAISQRSLDRLC